MCGRFAYQASNKEFEAQFGIAAPESLSASFNITPQSSIAVVRADGAAMLSWGLLPFWAKDKKIAWKTINARAETVTEKPAFRAAWKKRRCIIPASGYFEWQRSGNGKQPWYIHSAGDDLLAMAGLWERWEGRGPDKGVVIESCTIITTAANADCESVHHRMPVMLEPEQYAQWLEAPDTELLAAPAAGRLRAHAVSTRVNSPTNNDAQLLEPLSVQDCQKPLSTLRQV